MSAWMTSLQDWIVAAGDTWWVQFMVFGLCAVDAFFPTVPSESVIVALSSLWASSSVPPIWQTVLAAWGGAFLGDNIAYLIGRTVGWQRFGFLHRGRGLAAVQAAERGLDRRALLFLMTARYIPFGRTAVNLTAGAVGYPWRKFWHRSLAATFVWAAYSCGIGAVAGSWFEDNHLLAITVAVVIAVVVALVVERLVALLNRVLDRRHERAAEERTAAQEPAERGTAGQDSIDRDSIDQDRDEQSSTHRDLNDQDSTDRGEHDRIHRAEALPGDADPDLVEGAHAPAASTIPTTPVREDDGSIAADRPAEDDHDSRRTASPA